jgi:hypothetical protein
MRNLGSTYNSARIAAELAALSFSLRAARLRELIRKAGFRPDQPRVPAGNPDGGQWTDDLRGAGSDASEDFPLILVSANYEGPPPKIPDKEPKTAKERNSIAYGLARYLAAISPTDEIARGVTWLRDHADRISAYLEPPKTLDELREAARTSRPGHDIHHIVEQSSARQDGFSEEEINSPENLVSIPTYRHWDINRWYSKPNDQFGG